jgi:uncharacterized membrane protein YccC
VIQLPSHSWILITGGIPTGACRHCGVGETVPPPGNPIVLTAATVAVVLTAMAATHPSRRHLTSALTTYIVFLLLLGGSTQDAEHRFLERLTETILGVVLALIFGVLIPRLG